MAQATLSTIVASPKIRVARPVWLLGTIGGCALLLMAALALPIFWGHVYVADDLGAFHLPARAFYAESLARGDSFHWSPQLFNGFYFTGEGQAGVFHPLHWGLYRWLPLPVAFNLEVLLSYPWMLLGMYLWLRRRLPRADAALFGALLFTFCSFNLLHLPHVNAIAVLAQLPWLLWAIDVVVRDTRPRWRMLATAAIPLLTASQLLLGYPQYVWISLLLQAGYAWWLLRHGPPAWLVVERGGRHVLRRGSGSRARIWLTLAAAVGIGFLLGAVQLLPTYDMLSTSVRQDSGTAFAESGSLHPWNVMQLVAPYLFENRVVGQNTHELGLYAGCVPLMLCAWLWIRRRELGGLRALIAAAAVVAILSLWMAFGEYGFIYRFQTWLPVVGKFRFPCRMIVLFQLAMSVLAAAALSLLAARHPARMPIAQKGYTLLWVLVGLSAAIAIIAALAWPQHVASWPVIVAGPLLFGITAALVWLADHNSRAALVGLVILAAIDLGAYGMSYSVYGQTETLESFAQAWPAPPQNNQTRLLVESPASDPHAPREGNQSLLSGWSRARGYAGLEPASRLDYGQRNAQRVAGIGWLGTERKTNQVRRVIATPTTPLPAARLLAHVQSSRNPARDIEQIDPATTALVEPGFDQLHVFGQGPAGTIEAGTALIDQQSPGHLVIDTHAKGANVLVMNQSWHGGWKASVDGKPVAVERVNGDFFGCVVPPGDHRVQFNFQPASLRYGAMLSAGGLACFLFGFAWLAKTGRVRECDKERNA
ncbi:MAG: YfhO family protein [Planctomycetes bacterium]|nr:YfhO family protein [Planctomycetota bacterium]